MKMRSEEPNETSYRRTVFMGKLHAHYQGRVNYDITLCDSDKYYDIELLNGTITTNTSDIIKNVNQETWDEISSSDELKSNLKIPDNIHWIINDETRQFRIKDRRFKHLITSNIRFIDTIYENELVIGTILCDVAGLKEKLITTEKDQTYKDPSSIEDKVPDTTPGPKGDKPLPPPEPEPEGCWDQIKSLFQVLAWAWLALLALNLIIHAWPFLIAVLLFSGISWLLGRMGSIPAVLSSILGWLLRLFLFIMLIAALYYLFDNFSKPKPVPVEESHDELIEYTLVTSPDIFERIMPYQLPDSSMEYQTFRINLKDLKDEIAHRNSISTSLTTPRAYSRLLKDVHEYSLPNLEWTFDTLEMIKMKHGLNDRQFFEVLLSWVQLIPYSLVLDDACDYHYYRDPFVVQSLQSGMFCIPNVRFGLLTPLESMHYGRSDCDSKALLLFSVLKHFEYDVLIMSSLVDRHAIVGVGLPYHGYRREALGRTFTLLETTAVYPPGTLEKPIQPYKHWDINLIHLSNPN
jgi:hypothetical protein